MTVKNCEKIEKSQVVLTIEVDAEEFDAAMEKAYRKMRRNLRVPGFRPGKAPRKMIEGMYGPEVFYDEAVNFAAPDAYEAAVKEQELRVVGMPEMKMDEMPTKEGFTFTATAPVYPEVTLGQYKGLSAPREEVVVTPEDVQERLDTLQDRNSRLISVDRPAENGDTVIIDFDGYMDGKRFDGGKGENYSLELGSGSFVPGFEEQVVGMSADEEKDLDITFPQDYAPELAGKDVVFRVKVHEVKKKDVPELDDEFAKDVSEFDTLDELKADLEKQIREGRERGAQQAFEDELLTQVAENITADVPDALVDAQARQFMRNLQSQVYAQGLTYEQYQQMMGTDDEKLMETAREPALKQVRMDLAIGAIIDAEKLEASDEDVAAEYEKLAEDSGMDVESIKKYYDEERVREQVLTKKAIAVVADSATATKPEAAPAADAASEDAAPAESTAE